jgi:2-keto-4-pentenoate hydratase
LNHEAIANAAKLLAEARRSGRLLAGLPPECQPRSASEAYQIQLRAMEELGEGAAGWKVAMTPEYGTLVGAIMRSLVFEDGSEISSRGMTMMGVEAEIAFRFKQALPPRESPYERADVERAVTAFPAIEIVDSRYRSFDDATTNERAADFMSNGAFVAGVPVSSWRALDLAKLEVRLAIDGVEVVRRVGGHAAGDPLIPAIAFCNQLRMTDGVAAGQFVTTGTFTGLQFVKPDSAVRATFVGFGETLCRFVET